MADYLPPVVTRLTADISDFVAKMQAAKDMVDSLAKSGASIPVKFDINQASYAKVVTANAALTKLHPTIPVNYNVNTAGIVAATAATNKLAGAATRAYRPWYLTGTAIHWVISGASELAAVLIPATIAAAAWGFIWVQGATNVYQHLSALFGATEALGQAAGQTYGELLGLKGVFQQLQNAANPDVYQALGGALNTIKESAGGLAQTGLQVGKIFDTFMAKLVYDFSAAGGAGKTMGAVLHDMIPDLVHIGQVFGNLGAVLAGLAAQMPGLAEILLSGLSGFLNIVKIVVGLIGKFQVFGFTLLTAAMALEEFMRWGGLLVSALGKMGFAVEDLGDKFLSMQRLSGVFRSLFMAVPQLVGGAISALGNLMMRFSAVEESGLKLSILGEDFTDAFAGLSTGAMFGIAAAAIALGFLVDKLVTAKSAAQQFADSLENAVSKASNLQALNVMATSMGKLDIATKAADASVAKYTTTTAHAGVGLGRVNQELSNQGFQATKAAMAANTYTTAQQKMAQQFATTTSRATQLANTYHTNLTTAMLLASDANVKLASNMTKTGWAIAQIKVADLVAGFKAMGTPMGVVGKDMNALAIQSGLAGTKISQLNGAWDQFMQNISGGTNGLSGFENSLKNMGNTAAKESENLSESNVKMSASTLKFANNLKSYTGQGAQAWQNFDQVIGTTAPQMVDWLRTAGAEGAISSNQFTGAVKDMVAQMLPLASKSKTATSELDDLAQQAGGPTTDNFKTLKGWVDKGHTSIGSLAQIVSQATQKMGNMADVAQQLGNVVNNDIIDAMGQARLKVAGVAQATVTYEQDLRANTQATTAGHSARTTLIKDLEFAGESAKQAREMVKLLAAQISGLHSKTVTITTLAKNIGTVGALHERAPSGFASGTRGASPGWHMVGENGPEMEYFGGGETVIPHGRSVTGYAGGTPGAEGTSVHETHVYLDGKEMFGSVRTRTRQYNIANGNRGKNGEVAGTMAPR